MPANPMTPRAKLLAGAGMALLLVIGSGALAVWMSLRSPDSSYAGASSLGGPFTLVADDGSQVTDQSFRGKWLLIYFGYTYCPDACPTALSEISTAMAKLGPGAAKVQPLFITVDPERDTVKVMSDYVHAFDGHIVGLTGTPAQIGAVAKEYRVYYERRKTDDGYLMDHTSLIYLIDPRGKFVRLFAGDMSGERMARYLTEIISATS